MEEKIEGNIHIYVAKDGTKFELEYDCIEYESRIARKKLKTSNNVIIISSDEIEASYLKYTKWFYIKNIEGAKELKEAFPWLRKFSFNIRNAENSVNKIIGIMNYNDPPFYKSAIAYELDDWISQTNNWINRYTAILGDLTKSKRSI